MKSVKKISDKTSAPVTYDVKEESERIKIALESLSKEKPGVVSRGGKKDVIFAVKEEIIDLMRRGYTAKQITEAIKTDTFNILPKTITEIANKTKLKKTMKKAKSLKITENSDNSSVENKIQNTEKTQISNASSQNKAQKRNVILKEDNEDL